MILLDDKYAIDFFMKYSLNYVSDLFVILDVFPNTALDRWRNGRSVGKVLAGIDTILAEIFKLQNA